MIFFKSHLTRHQAELYLKTITTLGKWRKAILPDIPAKFSFPFEARQNKMPICGDLPGERHFCFDGNQCTTATWGMRRNNNVCAAAASSWSHFQVESSK